MQEVDRRASMCACVCSCVCVGWKREKRTSIIKNTEFVLMEVLEGKEEQMQEVDRVSVQVSLFACVWYP